MTHGAKLIRRNQKRLLKRKYKGAIFQQYSIIEYMSLIRHHHISFKNAVNGLFWAFSTQPNFRVHFFLSLTVLILGFYLKISYLEMTILVLTIAFGLGIEMVNTSIEAMTDLITRQYRQEAKIAKDVAAGMMLLTSIFAVVIACLIFIPKIINIFEF